jgi:hypothetical protein
MKDNQLYKIDSADTVEQQDVILQADEVGELVRENEELKEALLREISIRTAERLNLNLQYQSQYQTH